jgi:adenosylcobinamide-phosphate guanylyltransferase
MASNDQNTSGSIRSLEGMRVPALIMAGGRGKRMGISGEKPLLQLMGRPLLDWVVAAVKSADLVSELFVVTSENTPETEMKCIRDNLNVVKTNAKGYHDDLKQALEKTRIHSPVLTVSSDVPSLTGEFLDKVITKFEENRMDALTVLVPVGQRLKLGMSISSTYPFEGESYCVCGVNVINGAKISEEKLSEQAFITTDLEATLNINTLTDLEVAQKILLELEKGNQSAGNM